MWRRLIVISLCWLAAAGVWAAPKKAGPSVPAGNRYLFMVETSNGMLPFDHAGRQAVFDLIFSGVGDQLQAGDSFGLWTFGEQVSAGVFPIQVWQPGQNVQLASQVGLFLKSCHYDSQGRLERALPKLLGLIKAVKDVNILIVSSPDVLWHGTSLDRDLNSSYQKSGPQSRASRRPLVTALVARNGAITQWSVSLAGDPIPLPKAPTPKPAQGVVEHPPDPGPKGGPTNTVSAIGITVAGTNAAPQSATAAASTAAASTAANEPAAPDLAETQPERPAPAHGSIRSLVITSKGTETNGEVRPKTPSPASGAKEPVATSLPPDSPQPPAAATNAHPVPELALPPVPAHRPLPELWPPPTPVAARERTGPTSTQSPATTSPSPSLAVASPPQPSLTPRTMFLIGAGLAVLAASILFLVLRFLRPAPQPSFITQSFNRDKS